MLDRVVEALAIPAEARVNRRVPKTLLLEHGAPTAADRRQVQDNIDEITWVAALKPVNIGVPAFRDDVREYLEVAVVTMRLRGRAQAPRLIELLHRAIPYPLLLATRLPPDGDHERVVVSLAHQRRSLNEAAAVVVDEVVRTQALEAGAASDVERAFLSSLALAGLPRGDLFACYQGWIDRVTALHVAAVTGSYILPRTSAEATARREALDVHQRLSTEIARLRSVAKRERQTRRLVDINVQLQRLEAQRAEARDALSRA